MKYCIALLICLISTNWVQASSITYKTAKVDDLSIFYREAGEESKPTIVLLHGFPTSSQMYQGLLNELKDHFHLIAPDYPGFGQSSQPKMSVFEYSFENLTLVMEKFLKAIGIKKFSLYVMDYGAPIGFRLAVKNPDSIEALIIQNGNAYKEGLLEFWDPIKKYWNNLSEENAEPLKKFISPEGVRWQYTHGTRSPESINPDNWRLDLIHLTAEQNPEIQLKLFYDYRTNVEQYESFQNYFRTYSPKTLIVWGKNDYIFPSDGAWPYRRDLPEAQIHLLNTGHFALEEDGEFVGQLILNFLTP